MRRVTDARAHPIGRFTGRPLPRHAVPVSVQLSTSSVPSSGQRSDLLPSLTGLRAIAALGVFISHADALFPPSRSADDAAHAGSLLRASLNWGSYGVSLFFVLSGFVLAWTHPVDLPIRTYLGRRVARIWPVHVVVWSGFVVMALLGYGEPLGAVATLASLVLLQCWIPGQGLANAVNPVAWTLSIEMFFYAVFPFVIGPIRRLGRNALGMVAAACLAFGAALIIGVLDPRNITVSTFPPFRLWEFVLGIVAGVAVRAGYVRRAPNLVVSTVLLFASFWMVSRVHAVRGVALVLLTVAFLMMICRLALVDRSGRTSGVLRSRFAQEAGAWSYAFYLVQMLPLLVLEALDWRSGSWAETAGLIALWTVVSVGLSGALHVGVERPAVNWVRSRGRRRVVQPAERRGERLGTAPGRTVR